MLQPTFKPKLAFSNLSSGSKLPDQKQCLASGCLHLCQCRRSSTHLLATLHYSLQLINYFLLCSRFSPRFYLQLLPTSDRLQLNSGFLFGRSLQATTSPVSTVFLPTVSELKALHFWTFFSLLIHPAA